MASKRPQTMAKRAREMAVKERRERKRAKKAEAAAERAAAAEAVDAGAGDDEAQSETEDPREEPVTDFGDVPANGAPRIT